MINEIGIIGKGKMGRDIFNYLLPMDYKINLLCRKAEGVAEITAGVGKQLAKMHKRGLLSAGEYEKKQQTVRITNDPSQLANCDLVIESVIEDPIIKQGIFKDMEAIVSPECILATNTSSIPLPAVFADCRDQSRCLGIHFFFPVKLIRTVEVNTTSRTDGAVIQRAKDFLTAVDKAPFELKEEANLILNKVYTALTTQIYRIYEENYLSIAELDQLLKENLVTFGLFEVIDSTGLDIIVETIKNFMEPRYVNLYTPLLLKGKSLIEAGYQGGANGRGLAVFEEEHPPLRKALDSQGMEQYKNEVLLKMQSLLINELAYFVERGWVEKEAIGESVQEVLGLSENPWRLLERVGEPKIQMYLWENFYNSNDPVYQPAASFYSS